jgi:hypothetical protein
MGRLPRTLLFTCTPPRLLVHAYAAMPVSLQGTVFSFDLAVAAYSQSTQAVLLFRLDLPNTLSF